MIRIVRMLAQYFYPQRQTKVMNEGCATFCHYEIMNRLYERGQVNEGAMLEFMHSHSSVVFQPRFEDRFYSGINPYALGFAMMRDIQRMCVDPLHGVCIEIGAGRLHIMGHHPTRTQNEPATGPGRQ